MGRTAMSARPFPDDSLFWDFRRCPFEDRTGKVALLDQAWVGSNWMTGP